MEQYIVQPGDSLWKISRRFGVQINDLNSINGLNTNAKQHIIHPGQILVLPSKEKTYDTQLNLNICDLRWRPLKDVRLKLTFDGKIHDYITDGNGFLTGILIEDSTKGIKVELQHLDKKQFIVIANHPKAPLGNKTLKINSREMVVKGSTLVKTGTQQSTKQQEKEKTKNNNTLPTTPVARSTPAANKSQKHQTLPINQTTRTEGGIPTSVSNIGNVSEGLLLPPEAEKYRSYIIETAKKYNFLPEGLAALIYAESRWKANAINTIGSGAVGLGQFKPVTWLVMSTNSQSKVYKYLTKKYSYQTITYKNERLYGTVISPTEEVIEDEINKEVVLSLRSNEEYNIDMIGLYDRQGVDNIGKRLSSVSSLGPDELVKLAYLIHMNGESGAYDIIMNKKVTEKKYKIYSESSFQTRLQSNVNNREKEKRYLSIDETYRTAFIAWMVVFYDATVVPEHFRLKPTGKTYSIKDIIKKLNPDFNVKTNLPSLGTQTSSNNARVNQPVSTNTPANTSSRNATTSSTSAGANSSSPIQWCNPLVVCHIRTHGLRSARSASFGSSVRIGANGAPRPHQGVDIAAEPGTPIYAVADGRVAFITNRGDYGQQLCIVVQVDDLPLSKKSLCHNLREVYFFYAHLSEVSLNLSPHSPINSGDYIGKTGSTGNASRMTSIARGAHLHFEVRTRNPSRAGMLDRIDPIPFIDGFNYP
ncbi:peptidoglycan DD-metalloendopeptidase family protein [Yersinia frederiksenii]|uniref:peptidoglycan DD-metalloendopeptidase family protein n=1 Tax=Yersinia frederiksenii TaxID=29484 RepID=UPI0005DCAE4D|nr:peptidoglycan DD-metalloendopeptidase family protein [Yersinia frederiksenii]CNG30203.1 putative peptidase [Yersinia frederiksenii]